MAERIEKSIPWITILAICAMVAFGGAIVLKEVTASTDVIPQVEVGNVVPTVTASLNSEDGDIIVTGNNFKSINATATVTDTNGWDDIAAVTADLYWSAISPPATTCASTVTNINWCYYTDCSLTATTDSVGSYTCAYEIWFVAEPTAGTSSDEAGDWEVMITAVDNSNATGVASATQELNTLYYLIMDSAIDYGTVGLDGTSSEQELNATNAGNAPIDLELSGEDMEESGGYTIPVGQQRYSSSVDMGDWDDTIGVALTTTETGYDLDLPKPTETTTGDINSTTSLYWMIKIPETQYAGTYTGTNTLDACDDGQ